MKKRFVLLLTVTAALTLTACSKSNYNLPDSVDMTTIVPASGTLTEYFRNDFDAEDPVRMGKSDWANGGFFACYFTPDNISVENGIATLTINEGLSYKLEKYNKKNAGAEFTTNNKFGYGTYKVCMKPESNRGVISSFFLYDVDTADEIDIEFVGAGAEKSVQFNYYEGSSGVSHPHYHFLDFDPTKDFHEYGFEWTPDYIRWFVDGEEVHRVLATDDDLPTHDCQIMMNLWDGFPAPSWTSWGGKFDEKCLPVHAYYDYIEFTPYSLPSQQ